MCGIAGIWSKAPVAPNLIGMMTTAIRHRGPDDEGFISVNVGSGVVSPLVGLDSQIDGLYLEDSLAIANLFLGHRRLSIIDSTPAGHQPMADARGNLWIVFNGEIYNYIELKAELKGRYNFTTDTDTEAILAAYQVWGETCVDHFNGMWSFVIYDRTKNLLFGSRDRFGVKPFYYSLTSEHFVFASEIKALLILPFVEKRINHEAVFDYLSMGLEEQDVEGFFKGIFELKPASCFRFDLKRAEFSQWQYFELTYNDQWEKYDKNVASRHIEKVRELLSNAIRLRLRSDVSVGSCLSGGVDSSAIVCGINELLKTGAYDQVGERQKVFTASYDNTDIDESHWARLVSQKIQASWHQCKPKAEGLLKDLEDLVYYQEIPFGSTSIYAQYQVMKMAAESGVKVVLDGQGGDELFAGYPGYYRAFYSEIFKNFDTRRLMSEWQNFGNAPIRSASLCSDLLRLLLLKTLPGQLITLATKKSASENAFVTSEFWHEYDSRLYKVGQRANFSLNGALHGHMTGANLKVLLKYEDRNSMRFSIESRTPFADDLPLINYLFKLPASYKIHDGWSKYLLRESMRDIIPDEIRTRRDKIGFDTPEYYWLNDLRNEMRDYLTDDLKGLINVDKLKDDWPVLLKQQSRSGRTNVWRFINLAVWMKVYSLSG